MASNNKTSVASILDAVSISNSFSGGPISLGGKSIGSYVSFGRINPSNQKRSTVFATRIYSPVKIEVEATTRSALIKKVASELSKAMKAGTFPSDYEQKEDTE